MVAGFAIYHLFYVSLVICRFVGEVQNQDCMTREEEDRDGKGRIET